MKLRDKKVISSDFQAQRKLQIDEGVIIAKKIDVLRETLSSLEAQHRKFIEGARQELINATSSLESDKKLKQEEINKLEERRKELLKPLEDEWSELNKSKTLHAIEKDELSLKKEELNERESKIKKTEASNELTRKKLSELEEIAQRKAREASEDREIAQRLRKEAQAERDDHTREFERVSASLKKRDEELSTQRKYLDLVKTTLENKEKDLNNRERAINDKYETLQRSIKRLNQNGK